MTLTPGSLLGRALALLILAGLLTALGTFVALPLWQLAEGLDGRIAATERRLALERGVAESGSGLAPQLEQLRAAYASDTRFLKSPSEALAGAELQSLVQQIVLPRGASLLSTQVMSGEREGSFTRVALRVKLRASLEQMVEILYALETGTPYLFIDALTVTGAVLPQRPTVPVAYAPPAPLQVELDVQGYLRAEAP